LPAVHGQTSLPTICYPYYAVYAKNTWHLPGMTTIEISRRLKICQSAVSRSSMRRQKIEQENQFELIETEGIKS
jgi:hypothetical protein